VVYLCSWTSILQILTFCEHSCQYCWFELSLLVSANRCKTTSMLHRLLPLSCCCADYFQLSHSPSFSKWGWSISCCIPHRIHSFSVDCLWLSGLDDFLFVFIEWVCPSLIQRILCFENINPIILCMFLRLFCIFITGIAHILGTKWAIYIEHGLRHQDSFHQQMHTVIKYIKC